MRPSSGWPKWPFSQNFYSAVASVLALMGFCFCAIADVSHVIKYAPNPSYDNIPITPKTWEEVDLIYYSTISGHRYTNSIQLLRPIVWLHKRHMDTIGSKVTLSMPEFGIVNVMTTVKAIKPTQIDTRGVDWSKQKNAPVIGKFMRYVTDVRTYTFKDSLGHISHINATPNHPFYVKNKHGFVAIGNVSDDDTLVGAIGLGGKQVDGAVHLVCAKGKHRHCGVGYGNDGEAVAVYNFEVYRRHVYRVGVGKVLVHNGCEDPISNEEIGELDKKYVLSRSVHECAECQKSHPRYYKWETVDAIFKNRDMANNYVNDPFTREKIYFVKDVQNRKRYYPRGDELIEAYTINIDGGPSFLIPIKFRNYQEIGWVRDEIIYGRVKKAKFFFKSDKVIRPYYSVSASPDNKITHYFFKPALIPYNAAAYY